MCTATMVRSWAAAREFRTVTYTVTEIVAVYVLPSRADIRIALYTNDVCGYVYAETGELHGISSHYSKGRIDLRQIYPLWLHSPLLRVSSGL